MENQWQSIRERQEVSEGGKRWHKMEGGCGRRFKFASPLSPQLTTRLLHPFPATIPIMAWLFDRWHCMLWCLYPSPAPLTPMASPPPQVSMARTRQPSSLVFMEVRYCFFLVLLLLFILPGSEAILAKCQEDCTKNATGRPISKVTRPPHTKPYPYAIADSKWTGD